VLVLGSQAASSLSNVVVTILVAANSSAATFGRFALAMVGYQLAVGGIRSVAGEPLLTLYANQGPTRRRQIVADIQGTTLFLGSVCSALMMAACLWVGGEDRTALLALAVVLPPLLLQDTWRYLFVIDRPAAALAIDVVWLVAVLPALLLVPEGSGVGTYILVWGVSGGLGCIAGTILGWGVPTWPHPWRWLVEHSDMCWRYFTEFLTAQGISQASFAALAAVSGAAALGAARAAWVVYGVLVVLHSALYMVLVPEGVQARGKTAELRRKFLGASIVSISLSAGWMVLALLLPDSLGKLMFSDTWEDAQSLLLPMGLVMVAGGGLSGGLLGLRALGDARRGLRARLYSTPPQIVFPLAGALLDDARGFVLGMALGRLVGTAIWWAMFQDAIRADAETNGTATVAVDPATVAAATAVAVAGDV
jgi:hypothetical protein